MAAQQWKRWRVGPWSSVLPHQHEATMLLQLLSRRLEVGTPPWLQPYRREAVAPLLLLPTGGAPRVLTYSISLARGHTAVEVHGCHSPA
jgi:hypothetical protein